MKKILDCLDNIYRLRAEQDPLLRQLRLYGEIERAGHKPKAETLNGATLIQVLPERWKLNHAVAFKPTGFIKGVELADGTTIIFPKPIQYP